VAKFINLYKMYKITVICHRPEYDGLTSNMQSYYKIRKHGIFIHTMYGMY
jgi:hypothetical protein